MPGTFRTFRVWTLLALFVLGVGPVAHARELDRYLIAGPEGPERCKKITELCPVNEKVAAFYDGKKYASVVPPPVDRHAQSFDCDGSTGTLYFFQYITTRDKDQALLFARPVVTQGTDSPRILDWSGGFVILSFAKTPDDLKKILEEKVAPPPLFSQAREITFVSEITTAPVVSTATAVPVISSTATVPVISSSTLTISISTNITNLTNPTNLSTSTVPALSTAPAPAPPPLPPPPPVTLHNLVTPEDISAAMLKKVRKALDCREADLPKELVLPCEWFDAFRSAKSITPVILSTEARIGQGYRLYEDGSLGGEVFQAAVGSGEKGEINLYPLFPSNGAEELELRAVVATPNGKAVPKLTGEVVQRLENFTRPTGRTFMRTMGESWLAHRPNQTLYLRASGDLWILLTIAKPRDESFDPQSFTISAFK